MRQVTLLILAVLPMLPLAASAQSQERAKPKGTEVIDTVPSPSKVQAGKPLVEPVVTTRQVGGDTIQEYRLKGRLYKQVVKPSKGPVYTLIDEKGEGKFTRVDGPDAKIAVPMWVLLEW